MELGKKRGKDEGKQRKCSPRIRILVPTYPYSAIRKSELRSSKDKDREKDMIGGGV